MYIIRSTDWGYHLIFRGVGSRQVMEAWLEESSRLLEEVHGPFRVLADIRDLRPVPEETRPVMVLGQQLYRGAGMERSAVVVESLATVLQFRRIARDSGIDAWERYFNAQEPDCEERALAWLLDGVDPAADQCLATTEKKSRPSLLETAPRSSARES